MLSICSKQQQRRQLSNENEPIRERIWLRVHKAPVRIHRWRHVDIQATLHQTIESTNVGCCFFFLKKKEEDLHRNVSPIFLRTCNGTKLFSGSTTRTVDPERIS
jgi:hypothetical protein